MLVIDETLMAASGLNEKELKLEIAIFFFEKEILSLRRAAEFAGIHWLEFQEVLNKKKIPLHYDESML